MVFRIGAWLGVLLAVIGGCSSSSTGASSGGGTTNPNKKCFQTESGLACRCRVDDDAPNNDSDPYSSVTACTKPEGYAVKCFAENDEDGEECSCDAVSCYAPSADSCSCRRASLLFGASYKDRIAKLTDACPTPSSDTVCCKRSSEPDCDCSTLSECSEGYEQVDNCTAAVLVDKLNERTFVPSGECKLPSEL